MVAFGPNMEIPRNDGEALRWDVADLPVHVADRASEAGLLEVMLPPMTGVTRLTISCRVGWDAMR